MTKRNFREKLRRINALAAPDGWDDINLDLPAWRYVLIGAIIGGMFLFIASLGGALSATDWVFPLLIGALPLWLIPPLRVCYLRRRIVGEPDQKEH